VVLLVVLLLAVWPLLDQRGDFIADEGSYGLQASALTSTGWDAGYAFALVDPDGVLQPYHAARVDGPSLIPYAAHPTWPVALAASTSVLGESAGFRVWGVGSVVGLSVATAAIASTLGGRRLAPWAFWAAAVSPALANAWMLWAHAPAAALGAGLILGCLRSTEGRRWVALAAGCAAAAVLLRSEALLWAGAVGGALVVLGPDRPRRALGGGLAAAAVAALVLERWWISAITDGAGAGAVAARGEGATVAERLGGLRIALVDGAIASDGGQLAGLVVLVAMGGAVLALVRQRNELAIGLVAVAVVAAAARILVAPRDPVPGLLAAAPSLLLAAAWRPEDRSQRWLALCVAAYVAAIGLTIYPDGGAFQWGGRFFAPLTGLAVALAICGLARVADHWATAPPGRLTAVVAALLVVQGVGALVVPDRIRTWTADSVAQVAAEGRGVVITEGTQVARLDWRSWPDRCWIAIPEGQGSDGVRTVVGALAAAGVPEAAYAGVDADALAAAGLAPEAAASGRIGSVAIPGAAPTPALLPPYRCDG
jgi:hypothetical protein